MSLRRHLLAYAAVGIAAGRVAFAQSETASVVPPGPGSGLVVAEPNGANAPMLRGVISLDLKNVPLRTALREISRKLGGRLMYDESVSALPHRVTLKADQITIGRALRRMVEGTDVEVFVSQGSQERELVLLKRVAPLTSVIDSATIHGRVVDSTTSLPVGRVAVFLGTTGHRAMTNDNGRFTLPNVPPGDYVLTFRRIGYAQHRRSATVASGQELTIEVRLTPAANLLTEVVTTGSGERQRMEVANSVARIDAEKEVEENAYRNLSDLLAGRANGVNSTPGSGSVNSPSRQRIRGLNSITASNNPIVIIDGIRATSGYTECSNPNLNLRGCNQLPSRFDDIDVDDIESVEVLKGPSAAALWGSDAANGVIVIKTKRGRAGPTRWTVRYDEGFTHAPTNFRVPVQGLGTPPNGSAVIPCSLLDQAIGRCVAIDSVDGGFNRYAHPRTTSMATGRTTDVDVGVSGGNEMMQFYFSGGYKSELGTAKMPEIDQKLVRQSLGMALPSWMVRPDAKTTGGFTGRLTGQFNSKADYAVSVNFIQVDSRAGDDGVMGATSDTRSPADTFDLSNGWTHFYAERKYRTSRFIGSVSASWRPFSWLSGHAVIGRDYAFSNGGEYIRRNWCLPFCALTSNTAKGQVGHGEGRGMTQTLDLRGTITIPVRRDLQLRTSFGGQHVRETVHDFRGTAFDIPVGRTDFNSAPAANKTILQSWWEEATFGAYVEQALALNDRLFVSAAIRRDVSSTLGAEVAPLYPKWGLSWIVSEEPFFPFQDRGVSLRLRGAFGRAGVQPASAAKYRSFSQLPRFVEPDGTFGSNYATISGVGNAELRPERSTEREGGFELGLWNERVIVDLTGFHKFTKDAIVSRQLAPSIGLGSTTRQAYNVGNVRNTGMEARVYARFIDRPNIQASVDFGYATRTNRLISLGAGVEPFSITASNIDLATVRDNDGIVIPGYPLFGRWGRPILGFSDANGDGIITPNEVKLGDTLVFLGASQPKADYSIEPDLSFWNNRIRVSALIEHVQGLTQLNEWASTTRFFTASAFDPATPLLTQACIVAASSFVDDYCFYETVNVTRLRDISFGFSVPEHLAQRVRAQAMTIYVIGSNLGLWSTYEGVDPMVNTEDAAGNRLLGGAVVPRGKSWTIRAQLTF